MTPTCRCLRRPTTRSPWCCRMPRARGSRAGGRSRRTHCPRRNPAFLHVPPAAIPRLLVERDRSGVTVRGRASRSTGTYSSDHFASTTPLCAKISAISAVVVRPLRWLDCGAPGKQRRRRGRVGPAEGHRDAARHRADQGDDRRGPAGARQRLPTERDLAAQLGMSRSSMREAIRALTVLGVLEARHGSGIDVTQLEAGDLLETFGVVADLSRGPRLVELLEVRADLESTATALAAARITADQLAEVEKHLLAMNATDDPEDLRPRSGLPPRISRPPRATRPWPPSWRAVLAHVPCPGLAGATRRRAPSSATCR